MSAVEIIVARGHPNVIAENNTTFEVTKEHWITKRGDCIIAVGASIGAYELGNEFKNLAKNENAKIQVIVEAGGYRESAEGYGSSDLSFEHPTDLVVRKSSFTCARTLMIKSNKAACDFSRELVQALKDPKQKIRIIIIVKA